MKRGIFLNVICVILMFFILAFPKDAILSASNSFNLWSTSIFPSLFPFFVLTSILKQTGILEQLIYKSAKRLDYNLIFTTAIGLVCGYPSTSKLIGSSNCTNPLPIYALSTCPSPVFIVGTVATVFLGNTKLSFYLLPAIYMSLLTTYIITRQFNSNTAASRSPMPKISTAPTAHLLTTAILDGLKSQGIILGIVTIVGIIVLSFEKANLFNLICIPLSPIAQIFNIPKSALPPFFKGLMEMTTGTNAISAESLPIYHKLLACGFLTSFGGMSIIMESMAFINEKIKATGIISVKLLHGILTYLYLRLLLWIFPISQTTALTAPKFHISAGTLFLLSSVICAFILLWLRRTLHQDS